MRVEALEGIFDMNDARLYFSHIPFEMIYSAIQLIHSTIQCIHTAIQLIYSTLQRLPHPLQMLQDHCIGNAGGFGALGHLC